MIRLPPNDLDYLGAAAHGRRSRMAEGARLDAWSRLQRLGDLGGAICPGVALRSAADLQRHLTQELVRELFDFAAAAGPPRASLLHWLLVRFELENLKVLARGLAGNLPVRQLEQHLLTLPWQSARRVRTLRSVRSVDELFDQLPAGLPCAWLVKTWKATRGLPQPFYFEALLDSGYYRELLARQASLGAHDREIIAPLLSQEVDIFHLMLALRGNFHYGLAPERLLPLHVPGTGLCRRRFAAIAGAGDLATAAGFAVGVALDALPVDGTPSDLTAVEALAWARFLRLAGRAFRQGHMGLGELVAYAGLRRIEVANLITLSEGIRAQLPVADIQARLIPARVREVAHV